MVGVVPVFCLCVESFVSCNRLPALCSKDFVNLSLRTPQRFLHIGAGLIDFFSFKLLIALLALVLLYIPLVSLSSKISEKS